jgi:hypothetical protein
MNQLNWAISKDSFDFLAEWINLDTLCHLSTKNPRTLISNCNVKYRVLQQLRKIQFTPINPI